jgi:hypothetical protein
MAFPAAGLRLRRRRISFAPPVGMGRFRVGIEWTQGVVRVVHGNRGRYRSPSRSRQSVACSPTAISNEDSENRHTQGGNDGV